MLQLLGTIKSPRGARFSRLVRKANAANAERRWADAAGAYAAALGINPAHAGIWVQYGHSLKEQGYLRQGEAAYLRAAALNPAEADTHLQLGHVLKLQGDTARAIAAYDAAHRRAPDMQHGRAERAALWAGAPEIGLVADQHLAPRPPLRPLRAAPGLGTSDLSGLLAAHALRPDFIALFDAFYYHQANAVVRMAIPRLDRVACLVHFCETGLDLGLPFSARDRFDPEFYCDAYLAGMPFTAGNAYRHWLNTGWPMQAAPNRERWLQARLGDGVQDLDAVDLALFAARIDPEMAGGRWTTLAERFMAEAGNPAWPLLPTERNAAAFAGLAGRLETSSQDQAGPWHAEAERAFRLRQLVAWHVPAHPANSRGYAQALQRRGSLVEAASRYLAETTRSAAAWAFLGLAECQEELGLSEASLVTLHSGLQAHPENSSMRRRAVEQTGRFWGREWDLAMALSRLGRVAEGQAQVRRAAALICRLGAPAECAGGMPIRRVVVAVDRPLPQCRLYRVDQKVEQLESAGYAVEVVDLAAGADAFRAAAVRHDAVIFFRIAAVPAAVAAIHAATELGLVTFYDIDDLIFDTNYPDSFDSFCGLITREEHSGLALAVPLFEQAMSLCSFGIASTPTLAAAMRRRVRSGTVFVHPNALGSIHRAFIEAAAPGAGAPRADRPVTLFYGSGTKAHKADFRDQVEPALVEIVRRHTGRVAIVLVGEFPDSPRLGAIADHVTILEPVWDIETYWSILATADINIAVLQPSAMTDAKSEIKWLEAAMLAIPSVVSDTARYREVVRDGETGLICRTPADWTAALDRLVRDPGLRRRIGEAARRQVLCDYGEAAMAARMGALVREASPAPDERPLIVVVNVFYPPQEIGGATQVVHDNIRDLVAISGERFRYEVFTSIDGGDPYEPTSYVRDGVRVTGIGVLTPPDEYRATDGRVGAMFGEYLDRVRPALVHFHCIQRLTASVVMATQARGIPYLISVHDGWWISEAQFLLDQNAEVQTYDFADPGTILRALGGSAYARATTLRRALWGARGILAVSETFAAIYRGCGVPNVTTAANGVRTLPRVARKSATDGKVRLGFVGGIQRHKGYDLVRIALEARRYQNLSLLVIDHGLPEGEIRQERWGSVAVEVQAKWPHRSVAGLYAQIDVLLAPSLWPESFGLVTREALQCGCWVVASDRGSIGACVTEGKNGFLVDVASPKTLILMLAQIDGSADRFRTPPEFHPPLRRPEDQAAELAVLYDTVLSANPSR